MKVGIITHYYNSKNYGGSLQAYALQKYIEKLGYDAEQICYSRAADKRLHSRKFHIRKILGFVKRKLLSPFKWIQNKIHKDVCAQIIKRYGAIDSFNQKVPHSNIVYDAKTFPLIDEIYDVLITGSDQVWHPAAVCDAYLLYTGENRRSMAKKMSYAASCAVNSLDDTVKERYKKVLADYSAVSVREKNAVEMIFPLSPVDVHWTLDPVFLLNAEEWDKIVPEREVAERYVFCYFLGDNDENRMLASDYAKKKGLLLVTIPYLNGTFRKCDRYFGDEKIYEASPLDFISLIKYADCVFTDSFHATAFSLIYSKQYFVFERKTTVSMESRLYSISEIFGTLDRFCDSAEKMTSDYLCGTPDINYSVVTKKYVNILSDSISYLKNNLLKAEKSNDDMQ